MQNSPNKVLFQQQIKQLIQAFSFAFLVKLRAATLLLILMKTKRTTKKMMTLKQLQETDLSNQIWHLKLKKRKM